MDKELRPISEVAGRPLVWSQLNGFSFTRKFELRAGNIVAARLRIREWFGLAAEAETTDGAWNFSMNVFGRVKIRVAGAESEGPWFRSDRNYLWLEGCRSRQRYRWLSPDLLDEADEPVVHFERRFALHNLECEVRVEPRAISNPDLSLLVPLGWYKLIVESLPDAGAGPF